MILHDTCFLSDKPREGRSVGTLAAPGRAAREQAGDPDRGSRLRRLAARPASLRIGLAWRGMVRQSPGPQIRAVAPAAPIGRLPRQTGLRPSTLRVPEPSSTGQRRPTHRWLIQPAWPSGGSQDAPELFKCFRVITRKLACQLKNQPVRTELAPCGFVSVRVDELAAIHGAAFPCVIADATVSVQQG